MANSGNTASQNQKAEIIALACSDGPEGRARWTLELLHRDLA
ncbi:MAG: hypothetical protein WD426_01880 [Anditalea sp.]